MIEKNLPDNLLTLLQKGNEKAFESIFHHYYRPLTLFAMKYVDDVEDAKEITQEFFIRLWSRHQQLRITNLKSYLFKGIRNACLNYIESNKVAEGRFKEYNPETIDDDALNKMLIAEQEEELMKAIDNLPPRCREIFLLSRTEQLSNQEIANQLNVSVKTVESQMTIALKRLRELLLILIFLYLMFS